MTYVSARDLATLARSEIENHYALYKKFYSQPSFTWGKTWASGQDITQANRNPILGQVPGADGLKTGHTDEAGYGFTGSADQNGRRLIEVLAGLPSWNARVQESTRLITLGLRRVDRPSRCSRPAPRSAPRRSSWAASSEVDLVAPRNLAVTVPAGLASGATSDEDPLPGPARSRRSPRASRSPSWSSPPATRRRRSCRWLPARTSAAPASSAASGSASSRCSGWRDGARASSSASKAGRGSASRPRSKRWPRRSKQRGIDVPRHPRAGRQRRSGEDPRAAAGRRRGAMGSPRRGAAVRGRARRPCREDHSPGSGGGPLGDVRPLRRQLARLSGRRRRPRHRGGARDQRLRRSATSFPTEPWC